MKLKQTITGKSEEAENGQNQQKGFTRAQQKQNRSKKKARDLNHFLHHIFHPHSTSKYNKFVVKTQIRLQMKNQKKKKNREMYAHTLIQLRRFETEKKVHTHIKKIVNALYRKSDLQTRSRWISRYFQGLRSRCYFFCLRLL